MVKFVYKWGRKFFGVPDEDPVEKKKNEVVTAPEFNITQYAKKLGVTVTVLATAGAAALKIFDVPQTEGLVIAFLPIIAAALIGTSVVMAVDLASRAYLTAQGAAAAEPEEEEEEAEDEDKTEAEAEPAPGTELVAVAAGTVAWLKESESAHPVLAIAVGAGNTRYLIADGRRATQAQGDRTVDAIGGAPKWHDADAVRAVKPAKWK